MPLPSLSYDITGGLVNARAANDLSSGQLTLAQGIYYIRGSGEAHWKKGRTAFSGTALGTPALGGAYLEFSQTTDQIVARAGTSFYRSDVGLTGTWTTVNSALLTSATGLWHAFANDRYYFNDGASPPFVLQYRLNTASFLFRSAGLLPPADTPLLTVNATGDTAITLTTATVTDTGDKSFTNKANFIDADKDTYCYVTLTNGGDLSRLRAIGYTGTGSGTRNNWILEATYEVTNVNNGRSTNTVEYTTDGGSIWTQFEQSTDAVSKHTVTIPLIGSFDSAQIGVRISLQKNGDTGRNTLNAFDTRLYTPDGTGTSNNTILTGLIYWITEAVDYLGIESIAGPPSISSSTFSLAASVQITLPSAPVNTLTTHYNIYRTSDGGAFPTGTRVASIPIGQAFFYDVGPLTSAASTLTYGIFNIAGVIYHRDVIPPVATVMTTFQNAIVVAPIDEPTRLRYSAGSFPESFPLSNKVSLGSDLDDTVMGMLPLSTRLAVFTKGRGVRIDHLPTPSDPTFGVAPENFVEDAGLESHNGIAYILPPTGEPSWIAFIARDGVRVTNMYQTYIITDNIRWSETVDVTALSSAILRTNASFNRLDVYCTPTAAFRELNGWPAGTNMVMWLHYFPDEEFDPRKVRVTYHPINVAGAWTVPYQGTDYDFLMSNGFNVDSGIVYVDEVGTSDAMLTVDASGTVYRRLQTGQIYSDPVSKLTRWRMLRLVIDTDAGSFTATVTVTGGRDDLGTSWPVSYTFSNVGGGAKPKWIDRSAQWHQILYNVDSATVIPPKIRGFSWTVEELGELV